LYVAALDHQGLVQLDTQAEEVGKEGF